MTDTPVEAHTQPKVTVDWYRSTPWWRLASQSLVISWRASHILLCAVALLLTQLWVSGAHMLFDRTVGTVEQSWISPFVFEPELANPLGLAPHGEAGPGPMMVWSKFLRPGFRWLQNPTLNGAADCVASLIGIIAIWSFVGGCLSRRSVVELGTRMTAPWAESVRLVFSRWQSIAWSVTMPSGLILLIAIVPLVIGWVSNIPVVGPWIAGPLLVVLLLASLGIGWCAAITLFGFPLSVCSIVTEKQADAYDGISRSAAYTFQRPLTLALCVLGAELLGRAGGAMFSLVVSTGYSVVNAGFQVGSFSNLEELHGFWSPMLTGIPRLFLVAFGFSFFWTATAAVYLILRRDVDHAEFDLIDMGVVGAPKALPELPQKELKETEANADSSAE